MSWLVDNLDLLMFVAAFFAILRGYPVTFSLAGVAVIFAALGAVLGAFDFSLMAALSQRIFGVMTNDVLIAIPLFVFMGVILEKSNIAEELLEEMGRLFGGLRGGLAVSVVIVGALLAASTGIVGATVVTMGLIALPAMMHHGYDRRFAAGTVCTAGTLGQIIPPSTLLIILSEVMSTSYQQAQYGQGKFTVDTISVGQTFAAALVPGLLLVSVYIVYILLRALFFPASAPSIARAPGDVVSFSSITRVLLPPIGLIVAVLGSILGGIATPSEAASVGAVGALLLAGLRLAPTGRGVLAVGLGIAALVLIVVLASSTTIRLQRSDAGPLQWLLGGLAGILVLGALVGIVQSLRLNARAGILRHVVTDTMTISSMIFGTIIGASVFSLVFRGLGGDGRIEDALQSLPGGADGALLFVMALIFVLGFFLDFVEISVILLPIVAPILMLMGHDPLWLSVLIAVNLQTSFLTPPFGFSLFYLRGAAPPEVTTGDIYRGVGPYIMLHIGAMLIIWLFPALALWLPGKLF